MPLLLRGAFATKGSLERGVSRRGLKLVPEVRKTEKAIQRFQASGNWLSELFELNSLMLWFSKNIQPRQIKACSPLDPGRS
jgi:hypothetical protein